MLDEDRHFRYFRMSADRFDDLGNRLKPKIQHQTTHSLPINVSQRLAIALWVLVLGSTQQAVAASYKLASCTVSNIMSKMCKVLCQALQPEFHPCPTTGMWEKNHSRFLEAVELPNCVGSIDRKHIRINRWRTQQGGGQA